MKEICISIATDFTPTPGGRYARDGKWSGEEFRDSLVAPKLAEAKVLGAALVINLDGTAGYATSFLEEAFGGLVRLLRTKVSSSITIATDNALRKREVMSYITDEEKKLG